MFPVQSVVDCVIRSPWIFISKNLYRAIRLASNRISIFLSPLRLLIRRDKSPGKAHSAHLHFLRAPLYPAAATCNQDLWSGKCLEYYVVAGRANKASGKKKRKRKKSALDERSSQSACSGPCFASRLPAAGDLSLHSRDAADYIKAERL